RYPFTFELPTGWVPPVSTPRWIRIADRSLHVIRPPAVQERAWGDLQARIDSAGRSVTEARAKLDPCDPPDRKRPPLKHALDLASAEHDATRRIAADVQTSIEIIDLLRACPVCLTTADVYAFEQTQNLFRCHCSECEATWGQRTCGACHGAFPFLDFPGNEPSEAVLEADRRYGADVLALPLVDQVYLCPNCGKRSDGADGVV